MRLILMAFVLLLPLSLMNRAQGFQDNRTKVDESHEDFSIPLNATRREELRIEKSDWFNKVYRDSYLKKPVKDRVRNSTLLGIYHDYFMLSYVNNDFVSSQRDMVLDRMVRARLEVDVDPVLVWLCLRLTYRDEAYHGLPARWSESAQEELKTILRQMEQRDVPEVIRAKLFADLVIGSAIDVKVSKQLPAQQKQKEANDFFLSYVKMIAGSFRDYQNYSTFDVLMSWEGMLEMAKYLQQDTSSWMAEVDKTLSGVEKAKALQGAMAGIYHIKAAWAIRGGATAGNVSDDAWKGFTKELKLAETSLVGAWTAAEQDNNHQLMGKIASYMITVGMGLQYDRPKVANWFRKGIAATGGDLGSYLNYLLYLDPKWHGSPQEMLALGRAALATKDWDSSVTRMVVIVHDKLSSLTASREKYLAHDDVWNDIETYYTNSIKEHPHSTKMNTEFLVFAIHAGKEDIAKKQFEALKGVLDPSVIKPWEQSKLLSKVGLELKQQPGSVPKK